MLAALVLGLLAVSLLLFAAPVYASEGEVLAACDCSVKADLLARFQVAKPIADPANGAMSRSEAEFYVAQFGAANVLSVASSEALARFQSVKSIADPANGAMSLSEAEFYVAQAQASQRGIDTDAARYQALGESYLAKSNRGIEAASARYQALGAFYAARGDALGQFQLAKPIVDPANGAMSLSEAEFYVAQAQTSQQRGIDADASRYQALGESYLAKSTRGIEAASARYQALGAFYAARGDALSRFQLAKPIADPANGALSLSEAEFYVAKYSAEPASLACTSWSDAIARFQLAKPIADPANGALSLSEAQFYVAKYGAERTGAGLATLEADGALALCSM
jgi:hypothetical protein